MSKKHYSVEMIPMDADGHRIIPTRVKITPYVEYSNEEQVFNPAYYSVVDADTRQELLRITDVNPVFELHVGSCIKAHVELPEEML